MRYPVIIIIALVLCSFVSPKEESGFSVKEYDSCYFVDTVANRYDYHFIDIKNETTENIWILFEKDTTMSNKKLILDRFRSKPTEGFGMTLYHFMVDGNVCWDAFRTELYSSFFKILGPGEVFTIIQNNNHRSDQYDITSFMRILTSDELRQIYKYLVPITPDTEPSYQPNVLVVE